MITKREIQRWSTVDTPTQFKLVVSGKTIAKLSSDNVNSPYLRGYFGRAARCCNACAYISHPEETIPKAIEVLNKAANAITHKHYDNVLDDIKEVLAELEGRI